MHPPNQCKLYILLKTALKLVHIFLVRSWFPTLQLLDRCNSVIQGFYGEMALLFFSWGGDSAGLKLDHSNQPFAAKMPYYT